MKKLLLLLVAVALSVGLLLARHLHAADDEPATATEFATIRWDGREHSFVVRPNAKVERLRPLFERHARPQDIDERAYYMNVAMNALAKEGYEFAGSVDGQVVMRRGGVK